MKYNGSCHCGAVKFEFESDAISSGIKCNCSICRRKGAVMTPFSLSSEDLKISIEEDALATYEFASGVAKHHFCRFCGIYPFHQTLRQPGFYRVNLGCIDGLEATSIAFDVFDGASL